MDAKGSFGSTPVSMTGECCVIQPHAAVFGWLIDAEETRVAEFLEQVMGGKQLGLFPFVNVRIDFLVDEAPGRSA